MNRKKRNSTLEKTKIQGALLRIERLHQNKGQKEICFGICVPSYLSKIEHGTVTPDEEIIHKLFQKMNISFYTEEEIAEELKKAIEVYFHKLAYAFDTKEIYEKLLQEVQILRYSERAIDWLLIQGMEGVPVLKELEELKDCMSRKQRAYYAILQFREKPEHSQAENWCKEAVETLDNCFSYANLLYMYFGQGNYTAIHQMENRFTAVALEEGNTYYLAEYYFMKGSAYACLNMETMMMQCYERSIRFLENTGWTELLGGLYYNIGGTYVSLKKYEEAITYLEKARAGVMTYHKLALAHIRKGDVQTGKEFLEKMKKEIEKENVSDETYWLRYDEACMECETDFLDKPEYLELLERLIVALKQNYPFGHLYFYKEQIVEAYKKQRKYKKALEFEEEISSRIAEIYD